MADAPPKLTKREMNHAALYADALRMIEYDVLNFAGRKKTIPDEWHQIAENPTSKKQRVTLYIEEDVVRFFRAMGPRYQPRINNVLRAWVEGRLARLIGGPGVTDIYTDARETGVDEGERPGWGDMADMLDEGRAQIADRDLVREIDKVEAEVARLEAARERVKELEGE